MFKIFLWIKYSLTYDICLGHSHKETDPSKQFIHSVAWVVVPWQDEKIRQERTQYA
jgi:hypothetical protein